MRQEAEAVERVDAQHGQPEVECHTREHSERDPLIETIQWRKLSFWYVLIYSWVLHIIWLIIILNKNSFKAGFANT